ncbi:hypothetical protein [Chryseobacterium sp. S90]|uniref:hypothetical protein n=1 Tax=Chryseobacterium sp. S90 TaxID=3395373 RepID=UPI0039BCAFE9
MKKQTLFFIIFLIMGNMMILAQNCNVNAGANAVICGTSTNLSGSPGGSTSGNPLWTLVSKPSGAPDPIIATPSGYNTNVTGMTYSGNYVFQIAQNCTTGTATSQVTITAPGDVSTFTAGADVTNVSAITGTTTLAGVIPTGYTASWTYYNISDGATTNATMANTNTATPTLSLIKKADHNIDPAYRAVLRITSINNPNCWYEDEAIVRFIPNPQIITNSSYSGCFPPQSFSYIDLSSSSPRFVTNNPNTSGNPAYGTTVTINAISQPAGANISFATLENQRMYFNGADISGTYVFTITVSNTNGTYTTPQITFTNNGAPPNRISFLDTAYPEQLTYRTSTDAGSVYCNMAGQTTPITFYFKINPADPATITTTANNTGTTPPGGNPSLVLNGAGTMNRNVTVTPPAGGWQIGTYKVGITVGSGVCTIVQPFYIHISDGNRPNVTVPNTTVCYPGSGVVTATIPLPSVYVGVINSSYLQDFTGKYQFTLVSKPSGAANPVYGTPTLTSTSTTISNLDKEGEYVFKIKAVPSGDPQFLDKEYSCSGTSLEGTFSIFVSAQVGSNAGSVQNVVGTATTFNGNNPGAASTGTWTLVSKPAGAQDPVIVTPSAYNTNVTGFINSGTYTFRWTVTTGTCTSSSDLTVNVSAPSPGGVAAAVWYKADAISSLDNTLVNQWIDQMGTGYNLVQATNTLQPTYSNQNTLANFNPTVTFNSTGHGTGQGGFMAADPGSGNEIIDRSKGSIYIAGKMNTLGAAGLAGFDQSMDYPGLHISNNATTDKLLFYTAGSGYTTLSTNLFADKKPFVAGSSWLNAAGATTANPLAKVWLDGNESVYNNTLNNVNTGNTARAFRIGRDTNWGSHDGQMNEAIVFATPLTASEKARVDSYLAVKWGTTLMGDYVSSSNNIVWNTSTTYQNNILGIARDNLSTLYQKQSRSENSGQKLIMGVGNSLANTNAANTNSLTEGQFLIAGDNGMKQELKTLLTYTAGTNGAVNSRFESIWKVQNTGNVENVTIAWPKGVNNIYLVQSSDATIDATDNFTSMATEVSVNGMVYNTATVILTDGQYFTFAGYAYAPGGVFSAAWYRADADANLFSDDGATIAADNATVQQWNEFNNKPFSLQQSTAGYRPKFSNTATLANFNPTVTYDGTQKWLQYAPLDAQGYILDRSKGALFSAGNTTSVNSSLLGFGVAGSGNAMDDPGLYNYTGNKFLFYPVIGEFDAQSTNTINGSYIGGGAWENSTGIGGNNAVNITLNGFHQTFTTNISNVNTAVNRNALMVGKADAGAQLIGQQNEMIVFAEKLTDEEINKVESYLAIKYGQTLSKEQNRNYLSSTGTVVWDGSTSNYYNNILGIARDNTSALYQKQSQSVNDGQKLIIGAGSSLANTNLGNSNSLTEGQFLITGDNGLKQGLSVPLSYTAGSNGIANFRFESTWKTQNTGNVGTVTVAWPKGVKNLYLVQSTDTVFDGTDIFTPMATEVIVNGVIYNTANVTLTDGQFFTFAGFGNAPGGVASGLSYWYRADKNALNTGTGTDVTGWTDMWNDTTVTQIGTNALPKYVLGTSNYFNFNPGINFTASTQAIGNISVSSLSSLNYDIFTLTKEGMAGARFLNLGRDNTTMNGTNWDSPAFYADGTVARRTNTGALVYLTNPGAVAYSTTTPSIMYNTFTDTTVSKGLNGAANGTTGSNTAIGLVNGGHIFGANNIAPLGGDDGGFTGNIGETIIYGAGTLSNTERRKVDSYLAIKYGITMGRVNTDHYLDANGNQVWNGGTNTAFNNNIFGVAREDIGLFEQKVSKSVNTGAILTVATTNDFVNPNQNTARTGFANDKTYFLLGDNNITTTTLSSITINGYTGGSRIPRVWLTQRTNTSSTMYFGADLSSYGAGFGSGDHVKMIIADDAAFTTNVVYVNGTYDAATGKWVHSYNFDSENAKRYITYAVVDEVACTTGCNDNTYLNASDPNTIEYDNIIASEMSTIIKQKDGSFYIWGPYTSPNVSSSNTNVVLNLLTPTKIDPTTSLPTAGSTGAGFNYTGTPLKAALQGGNTSGGISYLLTTDGLYIWGSANMYSGMANTYRTPNGNTFGKLTVNNKADGLPPGVSPTNVKMMSANQTTLTIVTCSGAVWTYSQSGAAYTYGDGMVVSTANDSKWHRVMTSATQTLDNVVAARGILGTKFVLTSDGKLYTWGNNTFHNDNTSGAISNYATEISVPAGVTPKMIGMTEGVNEGESSYYLLATNGKLYAMGYNNQKQLGLGDTVTRLNWTEVTATDGAQSLGGNIAWISPAENANNYPSINVLTTDGKQWGWGYSLRGQLGSVNTTGLNPTYIPGNGTAANELSLSDKVIAVEDGGYHAINFKENSTKYGFIGWNSYGTKGDGSSPVGGNDLKYTYISPLDICAKVVSSFCYKPGIIAGTALDTKVGITALGRAGAGTIDNWPMVRKGGWLALEAKTKGFVPNRVKFNASNQPVAADGVTPVITTPVEGMMVYDTTNKCMKIYTLKEGDPSMAWHRITTQACPD